MLVAFKVTLVGALRVWIFKPTNTNFANTRKMMEFFLLLILANKVTTKG